MLLSLIVLTSCVGKKKYMEVFTQNFSCEERENQLNKRLENTNVQIRQLVRENGLLETRIEQLEREKDDQRNTIAGLRSQVDDITGQAMSEQARLDKALKNKAAALEAREKVLNTMQSLRELNDAAVTDIQFKLFEAVGGFAEEDLSIELRDGSVVVSVYDKVMFDSGKTRVKARGQEVLQAVAQVTATHPELSVTVVGHTKYRGGYANARELSAVRAAKIGQLLTDKYAMDPQLLTVAGRGDSTPRFDDPDNPQNQRTEIVISPRFQEIYRVLRKN